MLKWNDVIRFANKGNPTPPRRVEKTNDEWRELLTEEDYYVTREKGTERAHSSEMCSLFEPGKYACKCCDTPLFDSGKKFESGSGWPSFTQPIEVEHVAYHKDSTFGMVRVETTCNVCDAHLGHVFPDGPAPSGLRYCINALSLHKIEKKKRRKPMKANVIFGGGCFWCTEAIFQEIEGVTEVKSGYSGGKVSDPSYREVCGGRTGHAEVIRVTYNTEKVTFKDLLRIHLVTHDPTTLNRQGADRGTQYRSIIFYENDEEKEVAQSVIAEVQEAYDDKIVTELKPFEHFYEAEEAHQDYYRSNPNGMYCQAVIAPKLAKFRKLYDDLKKTG